MTKQQKKDNLIGWVMTIGLVAVLILTNVACAYL